MITYQQLNTWPVALALMFVFFLVMVVIGYIVLKINDNRGRFSVSIMLAMMACVAILCVWVKLMLVVR